MPDPRKLRFNFLQALTVCPDCKLFAIMKL